MSRTHKYRTRIARKQRGQALILLFTAMFFGGSSALALGTLALGKSVEELERALPDVVVDTERLHAAKAALHNWTTHGKTVQKGYESAQNNVFKLLKKHDLSHAELDTEVDKLFDLGREGQQQWLIIQADLRASLTADEWSALLAQ